MDLLRRLRDYLITDIEVEFQQIPDISYRVIETNTSSGGALSTLKDKSKLRFVFHGGYLFGDGAYVILERDDGGQIKIQRKGTQTVEIRSFNTEDDIGQPDLFFVEIGQTIKPYGPYVAIKRIRHRDFKLFQLPDTTSAMQ